MQIHCFPLHLVFNWNLQLLYLPTPAYFQKFTFKLLFHFFVFINLFLSLLAYFFLVFSYEKRVLKLLFIFRISLAALKLFSLNIFMRKIISIFYDFLQFFLVTIFQEVKSVFVVGEIVLLYFVFNQLDTGAWIPKLYKVAGQYARHLACIAGQNLPTQTCCEKSIFKYSLLTHFQQANFRLMTNI